MKGLYIAFVVIALTGCGTSLKFTKIGSEFYGPSDKTKVQVLFSEPASKYSRIGLITWNFYRVGTTPPNIGNVVDRLITAAAAQGGDAVIVRKNETDRWNGNVLLIVADVVKLEEERK